MSSGDWHLKNLMRLSTQEGKWSFNPLSTSLGANIRRKRPTRQIGHWKKRAFTSEASRAINRLLSQVVAPVQQKVGPSASRCSPQPPNTASNRPNLGTIWFMGPVPPASPVPHQEWLELAGHDSYWSIFRQLNDGQSSSNRIEQSRPAMAVSCSDS